MKFWSHIGSDSHQSNILLPFFHLTGDEFWHLRAALGYELMVAQRQSAFKTLKTLREAVQYAYLDDELFEYLRQPVSRLTLVNTLITSWFSDKGSQVQRIWQINPFQDFENELLQTGGEVYQPEELEDEAKVVVRDAAFRRVVVSIYEHRCAFCGLQVVNSLGQNIVDGAHILPFSRFYDDRIDNGLSLCKNHHWAFDRGWFTIDDDYTLLVAEDLREESPHARPMREFDGDPILLPTQQIYHPRIEALRWHREHVFGVAV